MKKGKLTLIWGSMFSGKTEELLRLVNRAKYSRKRIIVFKPVMDDRYSNCSVMTHSKQEMIACNVSNAKDILSYLNANELDLISIDEVQFLDIEVIDVINFAINKGIDVICSGLDMDYKGEAFEVTMKLAPTAEECIKLSAVCTRCGNDAWISHRLINEDSKILLGGQESYTALCRTCYEKSKRS